MESESRAKLRSTFRTKLQAALDLELPYPERPPRASGAPASVLVLFGFEEEGEPSLLVTRRTDRVETHKGQMAFPGGMREAEESEHETALRETEEEVGIPRGRIEIIGELPKLWTVTGFWVTPVVALLSGSLSEAPLLLNDDEIAEVLWVPLRALQTPGVYQQEWIERGSIRFPIHCYYVGPERSLRIWGATGAMIQNLLERLG